VDQASGREIYRIGDLLLDGASKTLYREGEVVPLAYRSAQLLLELARNYPNVVKRIDLIETVWPTEDVTDQALSQRISVLRKEIGDTSESPRYIGLVWGWGYRLVAPVQRLTSSPDPLKATAHEDPPPPLLPKDRREAERRNGGAAEAGSCSEMDDRTGPPGKAEDHAIPLSAGQRLGPYEILALLGAGGMGEVYKARDTRLGREVAIKVLPAGFSKDRERLHRFEREAKAAAALNHPNILAIHDYGKEGDTAYAVMELLEGKTLRDRLLNGPLPVREAQDIAWQIARGLAAAHGRGIIHRDLKPSNIFITSSGHVKILDFGLAKFAGGPGDPPTSVSGKITGEAPTRPGAIMGTAGYLSPEQMRGLPADARSDIFAFGIVLYEMLSGQLAFGGDAPSDTLVALLTKDPPRLPPSTPPSLDRIVRHCLEKRPQDRFSSAHDLALALQAISGSGDRADAGPAAALASAWSRVRDRWRAWFGRSWTWVAALCAAVVLVAATVFLVQYAKAPVSQVALHQLTFRRGYLGAARFTPDGRNVVYAAAWDGKPLELFSVGLGSPESRPLGFTHSEPMGFFMNSDLALRLSGGTLAQVPFNGGAPREILAGVTWADLGPDPQHILAVLEESNTCRIEYPIGNVLFKAFRGISRARLSHSGDRVAFTQEDPRELWMVGADGKAVVLSKGWRHLDGLAWTPSDGEIWFTGGREGLNMALHAVTPGGRERLVYRAPGQLVLQDIFADGRVLLNRQSSRECLVAWDAEAGEERDLTWFDYGFLGALSADGSRVLFTERGEPVGGKNIVYIRGTDGSPAVRLGEGYGLDLSADGQWVLARAQGEMGDQLLILPTGTGQPRNLTNDGLNHASARWMPDGRRFVFLGNEPGHKSRIFVQEVEDGAPRPLTPEGSYSARMAVTPDGRDLAYLDLDKKSVCLVSTDGGEPRPLAGGQGLDMPITFSRDGRVLLVQRGSSVFRVDLKTGATALVREFKPTDPAGFFMRTILMTPDENAYAYGYYRELSDLFVAEGLK
jgi:eukaryotic-like serine/threonine-protein kinase